MIWALAALLIALNVIDWILTGAVLEAGGRELNPVMRWVIARGGCWAMLAFKLLVLAGVIAACAHFALPWLLAALCLFFAGVCAWNWRVLRGLE